MAATEFCIRACRDGGDNPKQHCNHIYDLQGCDWNVPGNYTAGFFEDCKGDTGLPMGIYGSSTFQQGQGATPSAHPAAPSSLCTSYSSLTNGLATLAAIPTSTTTGTIAATVVPSASASHTKSANAASAKVQWGAMSGTMGAIVCVVGAMLGGVAVL